jgi:hypothetical protein
VRRRFLSVTDCSSPAYKVGELRSAPHGRQSEQGDTDDGNEGFSASIR